MLVSSNLPIIQKARLLDYGHHQPLSKYHTLCLSFIIPHGSTDMWAFPIQKYALNYGSSCAFFMFQPMRVKYFFLFLYSFYHLKNDIQGPLLVQLAYSACIHSSWVWFPEWALTYLAFVHTILHYIRVIPRLRTGQVLSLVLTQCFVYMLLRKYETRDLSFGGTWIPLVIGHIMTNA